jgi:acetyl-CoA carboxylase carboxyl transferase subunit beta
MPNLPFARQGRFLSLPGAQHGQEIPDNLWVRCPNERCKELIYTKEYERNLRVCQKCQHHGRLSARERIAMLADEGTFVEADAELQPSDPLGFVSLGQSYRAKLAETQAKTGLNEAVVAGRALLDGLPVQLGACDFGFLGASMGSVFGEKVTRAVERALAAREPLVFVSCSGGARMHEGIFSLMQMAKTSAALARLGAARVPFFSVLTDPTTGGVTASFAGLGDVLIAEPGALIGFAGPRVIEQTTKQKLPPGAQRAEFLLEHGMVDLVVHRRDLRATLARLVRLYHPHGRSGAHGLNGWERR